MELYSLKQAQVDSRQPRQRYPHPQPAEDNGQIVQQAGEQLFQVVKLFDSFMKSPGNRTTVIRMQPVEQIREYLRSVASELLQRAKQDASAHDPGSWKQENWPHQETDAPYGSRRNEGYGHGPATSPW